MSPPPKLTRRGMTVGGVVAIGAAIVAGGIFEGPRLLRRRARGQYADLVNRLDNPEQAAALGKAIQYNSVEGNMLPDGRSLTEFAAEDLRTRLSKKPLTELISEDATDPKKVVEIDGWVLPLALFEICMLAAESV